VLAGKDDSPRPSICRPTVFSFRSRDKQTDGVNGLDHEKFQGKSTSRFVCWRLILLPLTKAGAKGAAALFSKEAFSWLNGYLFY
jgi:hypothetical protein